MRVVSRTSSKSEVYNVDPPETARREQDGVTGVVLHDVDGASQVIEVPRYFQKVRAFDRCEKLGLFSGFGVREILDMRALHVELVRRVVVLKFGKLGVPHGGEPGGESFASGKVGTTNVNGSVVTNDGEAPFLVFNSCSAVRAYC
jgi:hypothetical protein